MPADTGTQLLLSSSSDAEDPAQSFEERIHAHHYHPKTVTRIVTRIQALILELLPIEVDVDDIKSPTSNIITADVVDAFSKIAGDFAPAVPYALLEARRFFARQAANNPADQDENNGRKVACEAIARRIVQRTPMEDQYALLSKRFTRIESDGDESMPASALEAAVDQRATFFLASNEAQRCVFAVWKGLLVQQQQPDGNIEYELFKIRPEQRSFWWHFDPQRIAVPRYQFFFRVALWVLFLICYSFAIQTPERGWGPEDIILYTQLLGYLVEDIVKIYKIGIYATISVWQIVNWMIYSLSLVAFVFRCLDLSTRDAEKQAQYRELAFQWLSMAAPLVWAKVLTVFDLFRFFGVMQIVVWRMLKESAVFCVLLAILAIGFGQALTGLDIADQERDATHAVVNTLLQAVLGSPNFDYYDELESSYPFGLILYYAWSVATIVILLNVLVALFSSAYEDCVDQSEETWLGYFAGKTLIEVFIFPFEFVVSRKTYAKINRVIMSSLFIAPLFTIAIYETRISPVRRADLNALVCENDDYQEAEENPEPASEEREGAKISKVPFAQLKKRMPDLQRSQMGECLYQVLELKKELATMRAELAELRGKDDEKAKLEKEAKRAEEAAKAGKD
ncbi:Calcium channel yvc1 [Rhodotorula sphaerocarpa]